MCIDETQGIYDTTSHDTHCAHVGLQTCPNARVFMGKVFDSNTANEATPKCIEEASMHRCQEVHKFQLPQGTRFSGYNEQVHNAIRGANVMIKKDPDKTRPVLFSAATSNNRSTQ